MRNEDLITFSVKTLNGILCIYGFHHSIFLVSKGAIKLLCLIMEDLFPNTFLAAVFLALGVERSKCFVIV